MHMTAEALEGIKSEIQNLVIQVSGRPPRLRGQNDEQNEGKKRGK